MTRRELRKLCNLEAIASSDNLFLAAAKARRGKSRRPDVEDWSLRRETEIRLLREELLSGSYRPGPYHFFLIYEPKRREIAAAPFRDRVVHHALCNVLAPVLERRFIPRSFSCQVGKGTTAARDCCRRLTNQFRYVLKCDVHKFFPSIDHEILRGHLFEYIGDAGARNLIDLILSSYETGSIIAPALFAGDDLFPAQARPRGVPIGNLTSQLWGNFYLDGLDHWITEELRHGDYLRYTDDFLLFGNQKEELWDLRCGIVAQLADLRLRLSEPKSRLLTAGEGVPFCGFRFIPDQRPRILGATKRRFENRRFRLYKEKEISKLGISVFSWYQFSLEGNSQGLRKAYARWPMVASLRRRQRRKRTGVAGRFLDQ